LRCELRRGGWLISAVASPRDEDDYEWRPTFLPHMKLKRLEPRAFFERPSNRLFAAFAARIAVLDQPKRALRVLQQRARMGLCQSAVLAVAAGTLRLDTREQLLLALCVFG
jgi:hypothetical protein